MPAAVLTQANALRWLGSAQYELAGLLLILNGQTRYGATLTIEQACCAPLVPAATLWLHPVAAPLRCTPCFTPWLHLPPVLAMQADGSVTSRELGDFSFAQAQVNMHMGKKVPFARQS